MHLEQEIIMVPNLLWLYIGLLIVLFIIAMIVMAVAFRRSGRGNSGQEVPTITTPMPNQEQRNPQTRQEEDDTYTRAKGVDRDYSRASRRSDHERR